MKTKTQLTNRILSLVLAFVLVLLVPVHVHADDPAVPTDAEVKVTINGEDSYMTLFEAIDQAIRGTTVDNPAVVKLLKDINTSGYAIFNSSVFTLDLNGHTINSSGHFFNLQTENVNLTITDNSSNRDGSIIVTGTEKDCIFNYNDSNSFDPRTNVFTIEAGNLAAPHYGVDAGGGKLYIKGGTITGDNIGASAFGGYMEISGGTISSRNVGVTVNNSEVIITGGEIKGDTNGGGIAEEDEQNYGIAFYGGNTATISGGTFDGVDGIYVYEEDDPNGTTVTITGGTVTGRRFGVHANGLSIVNVNGGIIDGNEDIAIAGASVTGVAGLLTPTVTLGVADGASSGATFPGGFSLSIDKKVIKGLSLDGILADGAAYYAGTKRVYAGDGAIHIIGQGDITVRKHVARYTVTVNSAENGKVTAIPAAADEGDTVELTITPDEGYTLDTLTVTRDGGGEVVVTGNRFVMPASNVTVTATFKVGYTVTVNSSENGKVTAIPAAADEGDTVELTITPDEGYALDTLTVTRDGGGEVVVTDNRFIMPASNVTVTATFKGGYTVTVNSAENGRVTAGSATAGDGDTVGLTITPDDGYTLDTLTVKSDGGGEVVVTGNKFIMPASNVTVTATFKKLYLYPIWVGGEQVTNAMDGINGKTGKATYDPDSNTLTLNDYTYEGAGWKDAAIYHDGEALNIALVGENSVTHSGGNTYSYGIYSKGSITFKGEGSLTATGGIGTIMGMGGGSYGLYASYNITVEGGNPTGIGGATPGTRGGESYGVIASRGDITVIGGSLTGIAGDSPHRNGIFGKGGISIDGKFTNAAVWYGDNEEAAIAAGPQDISAIGSIYTKGYVKIAPNCDHSDSKHTTVADNGDGTHSFNCSDCGTTVTENHNKVYSVNEDTNTITAVCDVCRKDFGKATLKVPEFAYYTNSSVFSAGYGSSFENGEEVKLTYNDGDTEAPSSLGLHTATLTVYEGGEVKASVSAEYEITYLPSPQNAYDISGHSYYDETTQTYWFDDSATVTVNAPEGFKISKELGGDYGDSVSFSKGDDMVIYLRDENDAMTDKIEVEGVSFGKAGNTGSPATSDNGNAFLWLSLILISGSAVIALTVVDRKKRI